MWGSTLGERNEREREANGESEPFGQVTGPSTLARLQPTQIRLAYAHLAGYPALLYPSGFPCFSRCHGVLFLP